MDELQEAHAHADPEFQDEFASGLAHYLARPPPLHRAECLSAALGGSRIYLKREDLNHADTHKANNCIG